MLRVVRHDTPLERWELVTCRPDPRLQLYVNEYQGYVETAAAHAIRRREVPWPGVVLIINFGPAFRLTDPRIIASRADYGSFVAGLYDSYVITESTGLSHCIQVNLTPIGARLFFQLPMETIANRTVHLDDVLGATARRLQEQLHDAPTWDARFALLDSFIASRVFRAEPPSPKVVWAWHQLQLPGDDRRIGAIAAELGWSPRHLIARFRDHIGVPPKTLARIIRFHRVVRWLDGQLEVRWAELAHRAGYYDQAHFNRDFRELAGSTPGEILRRRVAGGGGIVED